MLVGALPGLVVRRAEGLLIERAAREREHGHGLAHPDIVLLEMLLPLPDVSLGVVLREDEIGLYPGNALSRVDEEIADAIGGHAATFVELIATGVGDGLDAALHADAVRAGEKFEAVFVPEVNAGLAADGDGPFG